MSDLHQYSNNVIAVVNSNPKQAALYFDRSIFVQPAYFPATASYKDPDDPLYQHILEVNRNTFRELGFDEIIVGHEKEKLTENQITTLLRRLDENAVWPTVKKLREQGLSAVPFFAYPDFYSVFGTGESEAIELKWVKARIVDTSKAEWSQVMELRTDKIAWRELRDFRLFMYDNYADKSPDYVADSIEQKIEKHNAACKKHGFQLLDAVVTSLVDSKSALGCLSLATASALLGQPITAAALGVSGATLAVGGMTVKLATKLVEYKTDIRSPELAFVLRARKHLTKPE